MSWIDETVKDLREALNVDLNDWQHLAVGLCALHAWPAEWWVGPAVGGALEVLQFFLLDRRRLHLPDRVLDVFGYSITILSLTELGGVSFALAALAWYAILWVFRRLEATP